MPVYENINRLAALVFKQKKPHALYLGIVRLTFP